MGEEKGSGHEFRTLFRHVILAAESNAPLTAGLARRLLDTLANIGI
jgi:hypothetical protein